MFNALNSRHCNRWREEMHSMQAIAIFTASQTAPAKRTGAAAPFLYFRSHTTGSFADYARSANDLGEPAPSADPIGESWTVIPGEPNDYPEDEAGGLPETRQRAGTDAVVRALRGHQALCPAVRD
jgi:hypothetical protein